MIPKHKQVRLKGKAMLALVKTVYERDQHRCVNCGKYVYEGHKPHHEPPKSHGGQDVLENMVLLCYDCHYKRHNTADGREIADKCLRYLGWMNNANC